MSIKADTYMPVVSLLTLLRNLDIIDVDLVLEAWRMRNNLYEKK